MFGYGYIQLPRQARQLDPYGYPRQTRQLVPYGPRSKFAFQEPEPAGWCRDCLTSGLSCQRSFNQCPLCMHDFNLADFNWKLLGTRASDFDGEDVEDVPSASGNSKQISTFTCFGRLPVEIRLDIWKKLLPPRIVYLIFDREEREGEYRTRSKLPDSAYACRESYDLATKSYEKAFGTEYSPPMTWFNFDIDTLYIDWRLIQALPLLEEEDRVFAEFQNVRRLAVLSDSEEIDSIRPLLRSFPNIKDLTFVERRHDHRHLRDLVFVEPTNVGAMLTLSRPEHDIDVEICFDNDRVRTNMTTIVPPVPGDSRCPQRPQRPILDANMPTPKYLIVTSSAKATQIRQAEKNFKDANKQSRARPWPFSSDASGSDVKFGPPDVPKFTPFY